MAAKCNDSLLNKSINDYQQLIQSKELRNQLIIKAQRDRTLRNFTTIEEEDMGLWTSYSRSRKNSICPGRDRFLMKDIGCKGRYRRICKQVTSSKYMKSKVEIEKRIF